jgi:hypothetical protein
VLIGNERRHLKEQRSHHTLLLNNFVALSKAFVDFVEHKAGANKQILNPNPSLQAAFADVTNSTYRLSHLEDHMQTLEKDLNDMERKLQTRENILYADMKRAQGGGTEYSSSAEEEVDDDDEADILSVYSAGTSDSHPLERQYYDRIGDVNIFRERLFNFESEHQRQRIIRKTREADGAQPMPPDGDFMESYIEARGALIQEYSMAKRDVQRLKELCRSLNLVVEEPNFPAEDEGDSLDRMLRYTREMSQSVAPSNPGRLRRSLDSPDIADFRIDDDEPKSRVHNWLIDLWKSRGSSGVKDNLDHVRNAAQDNGPSFKTNPRTAPGSIRNLQVPSTDVEEWTELQAAASVPLPNYQMLSSASRTPSISNESPRFDKWQGDIPLDRRRYSDPAEDVARNVRKEVLSPSP